MLSLWFQAVLLIPVGLFTFAVVNYVIPRLRRSSIAYLQGPESDSWLLGTLSKFWTQQSVGDLDFEWVRRYGRVVRLKAPLGEDTLLVADPKALQYIYHTTGYAFPKPPEVQDGSRDFLGRGIVWAHGTAHQRQRKVMNPAFTSGQLRGFLPIFQRSAERLSQKWRDLIQADLESPKSSAIESPKTTINVASWLPRATLDALGETAFDYQFGAIKGVDEPLSKQFRNLFIDVAFHPPASRQVLNHLKNYHPGWLLEAMRLVPTRQRKRTKEFMDVATNVSRTLIGRIQQGEWEAEEGSKDVMSVLARANAREEGNAKLTDEEVDAQLSTLMVAGTETSASTLNWALYELSKNQKLQEEVREEIRAFRERREMQGGENRFEMADLEGMKLTTAVLKETLRFHPIVYHMSRHASRDDVIPLSVPLVTKTGELINEIPIGKGQKILISIAAYNRDWFAFNRLKDVWGDDADEFNPYRFLEGHAYTDPEKEKERVKIGVLSNLLTFSAGVKACIGWRFAMIEMEAMIIEFIENFNFTPPETIQGEKLNGSLNINRAPVGIMIPLIEGRYELGVQMPLAVSIIGE